MIYEESLEQAQEYAHTALARMQQFGVAPNPDNFYVWYEYASGKHPDLNRAIDIVISNRRDFTEQVCTEIYEQFFASGEENDVRKVTQRLQGAMNEVLAWLNEAGTGTARYGEALQDFQGQVDRAGKNGTLQKLIAEILHETKSIEKHNQQLETRLGSSAQEIQRLKQSLNDVRREAMTDALTGIANRKFFDASLREAAQQAMEAGDDLCLLLLDIDHFKQFNDTWGHQIGDQVLKLVARTLTESVKGRDLPARFGGEEFAVILAKTKLEHAVTVAEQIRHNLSEKRLVKRSNGEQIGQVTISVGVARFEPGEPLADFVRRADEALYAAKRAGRNRVLAETMIERVVAR